MVVLIVVVDVVVESFIYVDNGVDCVVLSVDVDVVVESFTFVDNSVV